MQHCSVQPGCGVQACNCMIFPNLLASRMAFCTCRRSQLIGNVLKQSEVWKNPSNPSVRKKKDTPGIQLETPSMAGNHLLLRFCGLFKFFFQEQGKAWAPGRSGGSGHSQSLDVFNRFYICFTHALPICQGEKLKLPPGIDPASPFFCTLIASTYEVR